MKKLLHKISHLLKTNKGKPDAFYDGEKLMMSFLCECGHRSGIHPCDDVIDRELIPGLNEVITALDEALLEKIECSAIKYSNAIFLGKRHCDCFRVAATKNQRYSKMREVQGFLTSRDRFVDRAEARLIAIRAGQLLPRASKGVILYSEDIY
jgi:hypothetical protein